MLVCLQEYISPVTTPADAIVAFMWLTCFHKEFELATKSLFLPSMTLQTLHLTSMVFPLTPTIDSTQSNLTTHESWKRQFNS